MPKYKYKGTGPDGGQVRGVTEATTAKGAMVGLLDRDLTIRHIEEKRSVLKFELTKEKLPLGDLMHFSRQLSAFVRAGIPLLEALEVIGEETEDKTLQRVLAGAAEGLRTGDTFSAALLPYQSLFPTFYLDMLRAAEMTGRLDEVLDELAHYIERDLEARHKIRAALTYPIVILIASIATVVILAVWVLPRFKVFFASFNATLPLPTRMLLATTDFLSGWWWAVVGGIAAVLGLLFLIVRTRRGRKMKDRFLLWLPLIGQIIRFVIIERFCRLLAAMMDAGVPLPEAMAVLGRGTNNVPFEEGLGGAREAMLRGEGLARPMGESQLFPATVIQMVRVGENTGTLGAQLQLASDYYGQELEYKIKRLTSLFEPAVIVVMGLIVGFVAIALVSAMYGIYHQVQLT